MRLKQANAPRGFGSDFNVFLKGYLASHWVTPQLPVATMLHRKQLGDTMLLYMLLQGSQDLLRRVCYREVQHPLRHEGERS